MLGKELDDALLRHLQENARLSVAELSRRLSVSRSTVSDRLERLQRLGVIRGFTVLLGEESARHRVRAHVMVNVSTGQASGLVRSLRRIPGVLRAYAVSGIYDFIVLVEADSTEQLDGVLDQVRELHGVERTLTSIILSTKFEVG